MSLTIAEQHATDHDSAFAPVRVPGRGWRIASWVAQIAVAGILGQTLFFKFSGAPEAVVLFETLGAEPWGRLSVGAAEALAVVLLVVPRTALLGAILSAALMVGAIGSHLTKLGIVVNDDGGSLFAMAVVVLLSSLFVVYVRRAGVLALIRPRTAAETSTERENSAGDRAERPS